MYVDELGDTGRGLAMRLIARGHSRRLVLAIPRRGVIVGRAVALGLGAPFDLVLATPVTIGEDGSALRIGAVALPDVRIEDSDAATLSAADRAAALTAALTELERRLPILRGDTPLPEIADETVIIVDDAAITGTTFVAAATTVRARGPGRIVAALAVATPTAVDRIRSVVDELVVLETIPDAGAEEAHETAAALIVPPLTDDGIAAVARETRAAIGISLYGHLELDGVSAGDR